MEEASIEATTAADAPTGRYRLERGIEIPLTAEEVRRDDALADEAIADENHDTTPAGRSAPAMRTDEKETVHMAQKPMTMAQVVAHYEGQGMSPTEATKAAIESHPLQYEIEMLRSNPGSAGRARVAAHLETMGIEPAIATG